MSGLIPRYKQYATVTWTRGPWSGTLGNQYQSSYIDVADSTATAIRVASSSLSLWDLYGSYTGFKNWKLALGVQNLFDKDPPFTQPVDDVPGGLRPDVLRCARALRLRVGDVLVQVNAERLARQRRPRVGGGPVSLKRSTRRLGSPLGWDDAARRSEQVELRRFGVAAAGTASCRAARGPRSGRIACTRSRSASRMSCA